MNLHLPAVRSGLRENPCIHTGHSRLTVRSVTQCAINQVIRGPPPEAQLHGAVMDETTSASDQ